ncbi:hypothetical protein AB0I35_22460 [Nocardia sp. NPDC050378]|uniref:hypothetical protein n=1 Tax=Nocardia sp. NPDC050378 TaxID=3155400 RepID=UPI0033ED025F
MIDSYFTKHFRNALVELLDFQQSSRTHKDYGAFRTCREGIVTTYATAQAVEALVRVQNEVRHWVNPATVFDMLCHGAGSHHTDPQKIITAPSAPISMNSSAGAAVFALGSAAGLTVIILALMFDEGQLTELGEVRSRALVVWGSLMISFGLYCWAATVFTKLPTNRVGTFIFAGATTIAFPTMTFLLG